MGGVTELRGVHPILRHIQMLDGWIGDGNQTWQWEFSVSRETTRPRLEDLGNVAKDIWGT